jgi:hypothetical protein
MTVTLGPVIWKKGTARLLAGSFEDFNEPLGSLKDRE